MSDGKGLGAILEGVVREIVRQEVKAALAELAPSGGQVAAEPSWVTPPQAAQMTGVPAKAIRNMIKEGAIKPRLRNIARNPAQPKYLVNVKEVEAVAARWNATDNGRINIEERARRFLSDRESRK